MKLLKTESPYLDKDQWRKVLLALSIMTICLYTVAMVFSLCGSKYFILNYQNEQMDKIETFLRSYNLIAFLDNVFITFETTIILTFILKKIPRWYYVIACYSIPLGIAYAFNGIPSLMYSGILVFICVNILVIEQFISEHCFKRKIFGKQLLRFLIAEAVAFALQMMIWVIKAGYFDTTNHIQTISSAFIYAIEYDIALSVILFTISLFIDREKGDSKVWTSHKAGGFSQTSTKQSPKSLSKKNLTKTQRTKLRWLYAKFYLVQILGFLLLMVLPFLLGKVFEFLMMYLAFAVVRYILGFKYSLHYKKETLCIAVGVAVFGILSLAIPFFYVVVIIALVMGSGLAILLHFSYKYKGMWLFNKVSKPDKFAVLYVFFDGDLSEHHVKKMCKYNGLTNEQTQLVCDYVQGDKLSYLSKKYNYSLRMINYKLDESIEKLTA